MMWFPVTDWQFWASTLIVIGAAWWVMKDLLPSRSKGETKVSLTVEGEKKKKVRG